MPGGMFFDIRATRSEAWLAAFPIYSFRGILHSATGRGSAGGRLGSGEKKMAMRLKNGAADQTGIGAAVVLVSLLLSGCGNGSGAESGPKPGPPFKAVATVAEIMHDVVYPNADEVWESVGTIITMEGTEEIYPRSEDQWIAVEGSATTLMEAGNLLMMEGRAKDAERWMERARALVDAQIQGLCRGFGTGGQCRELQDTAG